MVYSTSCTSINHLLNARWLSFITTLSNWRIGYLRYACKMKNGNIMQRVPRKRHSISWGDVQTRPFIYSYYASAFNKSLSNINGECSSLFYYCALFSFLGRMMVFLLWTRYPISRKQVELLCSCVDGNVFLIVNTGPFARSLGTFCTTNFCYNRCLSQLALYYWSSEE